MSTDKNPDSECKVLIGVLGCECFCTDGMYWRSQSQSADMTLYYDYDNTSVM